MSLIAAFAEPWVLLALLLLPGLWWLLRAMPPAPRRQVFPPVALLAGLAGAETTPARTPWWLLALRMLAAAVVILGLAQPLRHIPPPPAGRAGPVLLVIDNGWASAADWPARRAAALAVLDRAAQTHRPVALLATAADALAAPPAVSALLPAAIARARLEALRPMPWPADRDADARALAEWRDKDGHDKDGHGRAGLVAYVADGLTGTGNFAAFAAALSAAGPVAEQCCGAPPLLLSAPRGGDPGVLHLRLASLPADQPRMIDVLAETGDGRVLARTTLSLPAGTGLARGTIALPVELRNRVSRLVLAGPASAAGTVLLDARWQLRPVGLLAAGSVEAANAPLSGPLYYVRRALAPYADLREAPLSTLLSRALSVLVLADQPLAPGAEQDRLAAWVRRGGVLLRFAGPRLAAAAPDPADRLLPVRLLGGERTLGGAMSWHHPQKLAPFPPGSPFAGLAVPADVTVSRQVLADPDRPASTAQAAGAPSGGAPANAMQANAMQANAMQAGAMQAGATEGDSTQGDARQGDATQAGATQTGAAEADGTQAGAMQAGATKPAEAGIGAPRDWARLADGTPLVSAARFGAGRLVLVHVTANADWSNLPLSGLFVEMLRRLVAQAAGVASPPPAAALAPISTLDGFGQAGPPSPAATVLKGAAFGSTPASARHPPGLYGLGAARLALNLGDATPAPRTASAIAGAVISPLAAAPASRKLGPALLAAALLLLAVDLLLSLGLRGLLRARATAALLLLLALPLAASWAVPQAQAQTAGLTASQPLAEQPNPALATRLGYIVTGDAMQDRLSRQGLIGLSEEVDQRTAATLTMPDAVVPGQTDLSFYPLLYWPITGDAAPPDAAAVAALNAFMAHGGILLIDTGADPAGAAGQTGSGAGLAGAGTAVLRRALRGLSIPPLAKLSSDHVLAHTFYLLHDFPGRYVGAPVWVERDADRANDSVSPVILGANDWAAAWAVDADGTNPYAAIPGGERQRVYAYRFGVNVVMYALTGTYKADQVHVPALLERLGQ